MPPQGLQHAQAELQSRITLVQAEEELIECLSLHDLIDEAMEIYRTRTTQQPVERSVEQVAIEATTPKAATKDGTVEDELVDLLCLAGPSTVSAAVGLSAPLDDAPGTAPTQLVKTKSAQQFEDFFANSHCNIFSPQHRRMDVMSPQTPKAIDAM